MTHPLTKVDARPRIDTSEIGRTGLVYYSGYVQEEELRQLQSPSIRNKIYKEMQTNDATIGAVLFLIEMLIRQVEWSVQAASEEDEDIEAKTFLEECLDDMSQSFEDTLAEILSFLPWGWAYHEIVYKRRNGQSSDPSKRSKYTDGRIGWRKMPLRAQDSLERWEFDDEGGVKGMIQRTDYLIATIPIEKALLFRASTYKGNPEGQSILRRAYVAWYRKKRIETIEAIGVERDLAGFPVMYVPSEWTDADAPAGMKTAYEDAKKLVTRIKRDEQEGAVLPSAFDADKNQTVKLELLTSAGKRQFDTNQIVKRYDEAIARTVLADFLFLGTGKTGSFALSSDKTELFATAIGSWLKMIASVFNRHAIPRLFELNGWSLEALPQLVPGDIEKADLEKLGAYVKILFEAGVDLSGIETANFLLDAAGLPLLPEDAGEDMDEIDEETEAEATMKAARAVIEKIDRAVS